MPNKLAPWPRPDFAPGGGDAMLFFVVFGEFDLSKPFGVAKYHSAGPGDWLSVDKLVRAAAPDEFAEYQSGPLWASVGRDAPVTAAEAERAPHAVVVRGAVKDPHTLDYFRDAVGVLAWLLDCGGTAVYDPQRLCLWAADEWKEEAFDTGEARPLAHIVVLVSDDDAHPGRNWVHTRGMRQYGRPDLSVRGVGPGRLDAVVELIERFAVSQARGQRIPDGQPVRMHPLPPGGECHHRGSLDDPDFNNAHIAIEWPEGALL